MLRIVVIVIIFIHGLIHLLGFVKAYKPQQVIQLKLPISKQMSLLWLACTFLLLLSAALLFLHKDIWWIPAVPAIVISQILIIKYWSDAKFGTFANVIILPALIIGFGTWQFSNTADKEIKSLLANTKIEKRTITQEMLSGLPPIVKKWLEHSNILSREMIQAIHLKQIGMMRTKPKGKWMPVRAIQWFSTREPGFIWIASVSAFPGLNLAGKDRYRNGHGHMLIKLLSLFPVVDVTGPEIDQGAIVRYLAEIIWFPSAALSNYLRWEEMDELSARATITCGENSASGIFTFDRQGNPISFEAKRYYNRSDGATLEPWFISIDPDGYKEFHGIHIPAKSAVTWKLKEGDFTWFKLELIDIVYDSYPNF